MQHFFKNISQTESKLTLRRSKNSKCLSMKFSIWFLLSIQFGLLTSWNKTFNYNIILHKKSWNKICIREFTRNSKVIGQFIFPTITINKHCQMSFFVYIFVICVSVLLQNQKRKIIQNTGQRTKYQIVQRTRFPYKKMKWITFFLVKCSWENPTNTKR